MTILASGVLLPRRSQYDFIDGFARHMRDALPHASFIGFTCTPIELADANTRAVFGDYISVYDIQRAVQDGATVRIHYESRLANRFRDPFDPFGLVLVRDMWLVGFNAPSLHTMYETLRKIARELVETGRKNVNVDWTIRAQLRVHFKRSLRRHKYPPDKQEKATLTVLERADVLSDG